MVHDSGLCHYCDQGACSNCDQGVCGNGDSGPCTHGDNGLCASGDHGLCVACDQGVCTSGDLGPCVHGDQGTCATCDQGVCSNGDHGNCIAGDNGRCANIDQAVCSHCDQGACTNTDLGVCFNGDHGACTSCDQGPCTHNDYGPCSSGDNGPCNVSDHGPCNNCDQGLCLHDDSYTCSICDQGVCTGCDQATCTNCDQGRCLSKDEGDCSFCDQGLRPPEDRAYLMADAVLGPYQYGLLVYPPKAATTFAANRLVQLCGVWDSPIIEAPTGFLNWTTLDWRVTVPTDTKLSFWVRSGPDLSTAIWQGPYLNSGSSIPSNGPRLQVRVALYANAWPTVPAPTPVVQQCRINALVSGTNSVFYTAALNFGFNPQYAILTFNGSIPEGAIVRAAVAGRETINTADYQVVTPGKTTALNNVPHLNKQIKVMLQVLGRQDVEVTITGLALNASGSGQTLLNR